MPTAPSFRQNPWPQLFLLATGSAFVLLGWAPKADRFTWFMENFPVIFGLPALILMVLGLSAAYELLEWQTAVWTGASADAFLGGQGDPWDTQWDMACALIGGGLALAFLTRAQDRFLASLQK
jgi:uncharacterized membrane protein YjdF